MNNRLIKLIWTQVSISFLSRKQIGGGWEADKPLHSWKKLEAWELDKVLHCWLINA